MRNFFIQRSLLETFKSDEFFMFLLWAVPVFMKLINFKESLIPVVAVAISFYCLILIIFRPFSFLIALPFLTLISPMVGFFNFFTGNFLLSDLFFLLLGLQIIVLIIRKNNKIKGFIFTKQLLLFSVIFVFSLASGIIHETIIGFKPIIYLVQLFFVYYYTINYSVEDLQKQKIINAWISACVLASFILIQAFVSGQNLQNILVDENKVIEDKSKLQYLFQATYYYSGFIYLLGISAIVTFIKFFLVFSRVKKLLYFLAFLLFLITLILMNNKTVIFSFLFVLIIIQISFISNGYINKRKFLINLSLFFSFLVTIIIPIVLRFIDENQFKLMIDRFTSSSSLESRIEVYSTSFYYWVINPLQIFIGTGPDFLDSSGVPAKAVKFKTSLTTGIEEGTVDSGWISYLIELGIFSFSILLSLFIKSIKAAYQKFKYQNKSILFNPIGIYVFASLLFTVLTLFTQMLGYTKTSWFPFQLLLFGLMFSNDRKKLNI